MKSHYRSQSDRKPVILQCFNEVLVGCMSRERHVSIPPILQEPNPKFKNRMIMIRHGAMNDVDELIKRVSTKQILSIASTNGKGQRELTEVFFSMWTQSSYRVTAGKSHSKFKSQVMLSLLLLQFCLNLHKKHSSRQFPA
jgi:ABC-type uncharacterized transport system ATPase subunit